MSARKAVAIALPSMIRVVVEAPSRALIASVPRSPDCHHTLVYGNVRAPSLPRPIASLPS
jgi:hypothetical protein